MMRYVVLIGALLASAGTAQAGEKPLYVAAPTWVKPAPEIDASKLGADAPMMLLFDAQQRLQDGETWSYVDLASRAVSEEALGQIGTIKLQWQPAHGDLIIHRAEIVRGAEHIDVLKGGAALSVLRREESLERWSMDGLLTATMPVEGLRIGDVLRFSYSVTNKDPTLKGNAQALAPLMFEPLRVQFAQVRLLWPKGSGMRWKALAPGATARVAESDGFEEVTIKLPVAKPADMPRDAPLRFQNVPLIEASSFADWAAISAVMAPLYETRDQIPAGSALADELGRIERASADPMERTALALQLVQEKVRYQLMGMANGNYVPQKPVETWTLRYGDCKAKTLLLLALLRGLGIEAEPVLANIQGGDLVPNRLPSAAAFDHVFVRATIGGESLWLDGTATGARRADLRDTPPFGNVLPVRSAGATLIQMPRRAPARATAIGAVELDQSAGLTFPSPFSATITVRGQGAGMLKLASAQASAADLEKMAESMLERSLGKVVLSTHRFSFDDAESSATLTATGLAVPQWGRQNDRWTLGIDPTAVQFAPDRARPAWRDLPVAGGPPVNVIDRLKIKLPYGGKGFAIEGDKAVAADLGVGKVDRAVTQDGAWVMLQNQYTSSGSEIPASAIPDLRKRIGQYGARPLRLTAGADFPAYWQQVDLGRRSKAFEPILAILSRRVAAKPDEPEAYVARAEFHASIFDREKAIADYGRAIALQPSPELLLARADLYEAVGESAKATADAEQASSLDPSSDDALLQLAMLKFHAGDRNAAEAMLQERIDLGGDGKARFLAARAQIQAETGEKDAALATADAALAEHPGNSMLLNSRCWLKGTMNVALDTALKDCTKAIELADDPVQALDSRAMVYFRMNRYDDALADLNAALAKNPDLAASLFLRGVVRKRSSDPASAGTDLVAAKMIAPRILEEYAKYGITP